MKLAGTRMKVMTLCCAALLPMAAAVGHAQSAANPPDLTGVWGIYRGGPGSRSEFPSARAQPAGSEAGVRQAVPSQRAEESAAAKRGEQLANTSAECIPYGVPTMMSIAIYPVEFIQTPKQITIISEAFSEVRRVYMDRPQAKLEDVAPGYYGRSVGHWEGDTLVVDTIGIKPTVTGYRGMPHSPQMRITERIRMLSPEILHDQITIDDPGGARKAGIHTRWPISACPATTRWWNLCATTIANISTRKASCA